MTYSNYDEAKRKFYEAAKMKLTGLDNWTMPGTNIGNDMLARSTPSLWGNPMWDEKDVAAGGVMPGEAQLLYGLVRALEPEYILEVGTSHGYSTLHLLAACRDNMRGKVITVESDKERNQKAQKNIIESGLAGYVALLYSIPHLEKIDLLFLDAGHKVKNVLDYIAQVKPGIHDQTVIVIHDAHFMNHAREAAEAIGWPYVLLSTVSLMGMAILSKGVKK